MSRRTTVAVCWVMQQATGQQPIMWGDSIVGLGQYHYKYASGQEGDSMITGFSPRKRNLMVYIMPGFSRFSRILGKLGKYQTGTSCLYLNKLDDVDLEKLELLVAQSFERMSE